VLTSTREHEVRFTARRHRSAPREEFVLVLERSAPVSSGLSDPQAEQAAEAWIRSTLEDQALDQVLARPPSAENLVVFVHAACAAMLTGLTEVRVCPEEGTWVAYRRQ